MLSKWIHTWYMAILQPGVEFLARLGLTPNMLTITSLIIVIIAAILFASRQTMVGLSVLLFGLFLDVLDDPLARVSGTQSPFGAFLDSICDHYSDFAIYFGLLWWSLANHANTEAILLFAAMFGSLIGSQIRSRAGMVGIDTKTIGVFTRLERMLILVIGILFGKLTIALWLLAVLNNFSALQRFMHTIQAAHANMLSSRHDANDVTEHQSEYSYRK